MTAQTPGQAAREAFGELGADWYPGTPWSGLHQDLRDQWERAARAGIAQAARPARLDGWTPGRIIFEAWRGTDTASALVPGWGGMGDGDRARWETAAIAAAAPATPHVATQADWERFAAKMEILADRTEVQEDLRRWAAAAREIAAQEPQPAPGRVMAVRGTIALRDAEIGQLRARVAELSGALAEAIRHVEPVDQNSELAIGEWQELAKRGTEEFPQFAREQPAPELAAAMAETRKAREQLATVLGWFGDNQSGRYARVSGTVLARAYRDGGLPVPSELARFL